MNDARKARVGKQVALPTPKKTVAALTAGFRNLRDKVNNEQEIRRDQTRTLTKLERVASNSSFIACCLADELTDKRDELDDTLGALSKAEDGFNLQANRADAFRRTSKMQALSIGRLRKAKAQKEDEALDAQTDLVNVEAALTIATTKEGTVLNEFKDQLKVYEDKIAELCVKLENAYVELEERRAAEIDTKAAYEQHIKELECKIISLNTAIERWKIEEEDLTCELEEHAAQLQECHRVTHNLQNRVRRLLLGKNKLEDFRALVNSTLQLKEDCIYTQRVRTLVRQLAIRSCPLKNIGPIINCFYQIFIKPLLLPSARIDRITIDSRTARRHIEEGHVASQMQMLIEFMRSTGQLIR